MNPDRPIRSSKVLRSAKGQPCAARFPGICNGNPETTVWAHLNGHAFGKGMGIKAHDILGFWCCSDCHRYYDVGHGTKPILTDNELVTSILAAVCMTWVGLIRGGIVIVPMDVETTFHSKPTKPRKPVEERAEIPRHVNPWPPKGSRKIPSRSKRKATT